MTLTAQELFDKVATHLLTQRERSVDMRACRYRGPNGLKCAIGALIPDDKYRPRFEGMSITSHGADEIRQAAGIGDDTKQLGVKLQFVHDAVCVDDWRTELKNVAIRFELSSAVLDQFKEA